MKLRWGASASVLCSVLLLLFLGSCRNIVPVQKVERRAADRRAEVPERAEPERFLEAAARGEMDALRELLLRDPGLLEVKGSGGWDALSYAAWNARAQAHSFLLEQGAEGNLFTEAALGPWESFLRRLETNPIGVSSRDPKQKATALLWAARTGNQAGCEVLLSRGADVRAADRDGNTAVHHASMMQQLDCLSFLLVAGAAADAANDRGQTALHLATAAGSYEACRLLLEQGASLDRADEQGNTPLHLAAGAGNFELCEYLLFLGAPVSPKNKNAQTPLDLARANGQEQVARLLAAHTF
jgi:ankyrin repeat protein